MKSFISVLVGTLIFVIFGLLATPFWGFNFGAKTTFFESCILFFIEYPFGLIEVLSKNYFVLILVLNGSFWSIIFLKGIPMLKRMYR